MCLIIAIISLIYAVSAFAAGSYATGALALLAALFFAGLLVRNIRAVRRAKR